jgi:N-acetylglucosamine transport system permease protein
MKLRLSPIQVFGRVLLAFFTLAVLLPFGWVLLSAIKPGPEIVANPWSWPKVPHWINFANAWNEGHIGGDFFNSLVVTLGTLAILIPTGAMAAYVLARFPFPGSKLLFGTFMGGMMFPNFLIVIPLFVLLNSLKLQDTLHGLVIVYVAYSLSFTIFVLSGFFQSLPNELAEASMLDGCTHSQTFYRIMLPLARPGLIVVAIFNAIGLWNEYALALVMIPSKNNETLPLGIANLTVTQQYQGDWGALFAGLVIVMVPVLVVYWIFKDKIHETMLAGAVKG